MYSILCVSSKFQPISASSPRCEGKEDWEGRTETVVNDRLWSRSIISWKIASIHILPRYAHMHSILPSKRKFRLHAVPFGNRCSRKGLGRRRKFKPDEGTEGKFDTSKFDSTTPRCGIFGFAARAHASSLLEFRKYVKLFLIAIYAVSSLLRSRF